jgi:hypothetical protein
MDPLDRLVTARMLVARAGERDAMRWWDSEALSQGGDFVLRRLFPRSHRKAAWRLAIEAARIRHATACPIGSIHLFDLGASLERRLGGSIRHDLWAVPPPPHDSDEFEAQIVGLGMSAKVSAQLTLPMDGGLLQLGTCSKEEAASPEFLLGLIPRLVRAYTLGTVGKPVLPHLVRT